MRISLKRILLVLFLIVLIYYSIILYFQLDFYRAGIINIQTAIGTQVQELPVTSNATTDYVSYVKLDKNGVSRIQIVDTKKDLDILHLILKLTKTEYIPYNKGQYLAITVPLFMDKGYIGRVKQSIIPIYIGNVPKDSPESDVDEDSMEDLDNYNKIDDFIVYQEKSEYLADARRYVYAMTTEGNFEGAVWRDGSYSIGNFYFHVSFSSKNKGIVEVYKRK